MEIQPLIGMGAAPLIVWQLTEHIKQFGRAVLATTDRRDPEGSPWPLVADLVGAGWALALYYGGLLPVDRPVLAVLAGLAVGVGVAKTYGAVTK